jgi:hypothetical protein
VRLLVRLRILEVEFHRNLAQLLDASHVNWGTNLLKQVHLGWILVLGPLEQEELSWLLFIHDQILSANDGQHPLAGRDLHGDDLIGLPLIRVLFDEVYLDLTLFYLLKVVNIVEFDNVDFADQESIHGVDWEATGAIEVILHHSDPEVMDILASVDVNGLIVRLVGNTVLHFATEHHLGAIHEVLHHILQLWHQGLPINDVEKNMRVSCNLDS